MIDAAIEKYPDQEYLINDLSSGIFNSFLGFGQIIGPLYGSLMTSKYGFRLACDYLAIFCLCFSFIYFTMGDGIGAFKESRCKDEGMPMDVGPSFMF